MDVRGCGGLYSTWPKIQVYQSRRVYEATIQLSPRRMAVPGNELVEKALDVLIVVEAADRTGYLAPYLSVPEEVAEEVWNKIPIWLYCDNCRANRHPARIKHNRCPRCRTTMESYRDMVEKDERSAAKRLKNGGIKVA